MRILIVDDDSKVVGLLSEAARAKGYDDIDVAESGEEAFSRVVMDTYDVITLDIQMPGASGLEVL
ncbi:MAG: response regulator, partial [Candidatus Latescibacteria bacterium]|nr:response regulator [Candidatus Latescibacterota bacterium]